MNGFDKSPFFLVLLFSLVIYFIVFNIFSFWYASVYAWDDGVITMAFGKTLAIHGKFSLTGMSEIVEGSSTILYTFISAAIEFLFEPDFYSTVFYVQLLTFIIVGFTGVLLYFSIKGIIPDRRLAAVISVSTISMPMFTMEIQNGMEMGLFAFLFLLLVYCYEKRSSLIYLIIPLLLLTRFEAIFYLGMSFFTLYIFDKNGRLYLMSLVVYLLVVFFIFTIIRYLYFDSILPNTIWAKINPPYSPYDVFSKLNNKIYGGLQFIYVNCIIILPIILFIFTNSALKRRIPKDIRFWIISYFFLFSLIAGNSLGYSGRMFLGVFPITVLLLTEQVYLDKMNMQRWSGLSLIPRFLKSQHLVCLLLMLTYLINIPTLFQSLSVSSVGGYYQKKTMPELIRNVVAEKARVSPNWLGGITAASYRQRGLIVDAIRKLARKDSIVYLVPDVGGLALCCDKVRIVDLALLTNRQLATQGYSALEDVLVKEKPDVIETHNMWSSASNIYNLDYFRKKYSPVVIQDSLFWLHENFFTVLRNRSTVKISVLQAIPDGVRNFTHPIDIAYINDGNQKDILSLGFDS